MHLHSAELCIKQACTAYPSQVAFTAFERYARLFGTEALIEEGPWAEEQRGDYEAGLIRINGELWRLRTARITPTKPGAFVAVWERDETGTTQPFPVAGLVQGLLVFVEDRDRFGVFRFTTSDLQRLGVTRSDSQPGKRGFRLYPAWCTDLNPQARRTQEAQSVAFTQLA